MNKKFVLIMVVFTATVPGFFLFSYWHLGIFTDMTVAEERGARIAAFVKTHAGDYNKTGEEVVQIKRLLASYALAFEAVLVYFDNAITTGKPYLRSAGGCIIHEKIPAHVLAEMTQKQITKRVFEMRNGFRLSVKAQTAVALRKVWREIARLSDRGIPLRFPLVQIVRDNGENDFFILREGES